MKAVLVGYGEIGRAVKDVLCRYHSIDTYDPFKGITDAKENEPYDVMLVAIPYGDDTFVDIIRAYKLKFNPDAVIVFSTVPVGTCRKIGADVVHSPVEGKHPNLAESISKFPRYVGGYNKTAMMFLREAESGGEFEIVRLAIPEHTEFLKLRSTTLYGINIEFARYSKKVADSLGLPFDYIKLWDNDVNTLYKKMFMPEYTRYILDPPRGAKGGHCVTPNARILYSQFPNPMVKEVAEIGGDADWDRETSNLMNSSTY